MTDMNDIPLVDLPGSEPWASAYDWGDTLGDKFPGQDARSFAYATTYNDLGPIPNAGAITSLVMEQQGENDGPVWIWRVSFADGSTWIVEGGCDYTGWDCQSHAFWTRAA